MGLLDLVTTSSKDVTDTIDTKDMIEIGTTAAVTGATGGVATLVPIAGKIFLEETVKDYLKGVGKKGHKSLKEISEEYDENDARSIVLGRACAGVCKLADPLFVEDVENIARSDPERLNEIIERTFLNEDGPNRDEIERIEWEFSAVFLGKEPPEDVDLEFDSDDHEALLEKLMDIFETDDVQEALSLFMLYEQFLSDLTDDFGMSVDEQQLSENDRAALANVKDTIDQMQARIEDFTALYIQTGVENQGFDQLTLNNFKHWDTFDKANKSPIDAWKAGFTFAELAERTDDEQRYYFERSLPEGHDLRGKTSDSETVSGAVVERLSTGHNLMLCGEPGMGKSHLCKLAATRWIDQGYGEAFYRETGGASFKDAAELKRAIETAQNNGGHALVVVEDATRTGARRIFEVIEKFRERSTDVSFLLDARTAEWDRYMNRNVENKDPPHSFLDADNAGLEEYSVPSVTVGDCERAIEVFNKTTNGYYDWSSDKLYEEVYDEQTDWGELLTLIDTLVREGSFEDTPPTANAATTVHDELWRSVDLSNDSDRLYYEVVVGAVLLTAAEIGVRSSMLYALAEERTDIDYIETLILGDSTRSQRRSDKVPQELNETFLFPSKGETERYRSRHSTWATSFLEYQIDDETVKPEFHQVIIDVIVKMAGLADEPQKRHGIQRKLNESGLEVTSLEQFDTGPAAEAATLLTEFYEMAAREETLAPLFDAPKPEQWGVEKTVFDSGIATEAVPEACSERLRFELLLLYADTIADLIDTYEKHEEQKQFLQKIERRATETLEQPDRQRIVAQTKRKLVETDISNVSRSWEERRMDCLDAINAYTEIGDQQEVAQTQRTIASMAAKDPTAPLEDVIECHRDAIETYTELGDHQEVARIQRTLARAIKFSGSWEKVAGFYQDAIETYTKIGDQQEVAQTERSLAFVSASKAVSATSWEDIARFYQDAIETYTKIGDQQEVAQTQRKLASAAQNEPSVSWEVVTGFYQDAIETYTKIGDQQEVARTQRELASAAGNESTVSWENVAGFYKDAIETYTKIGNRREVAQTQVWFASEAINEQTVSWEDVVDFYHDAIENFSDIGDQPSVARTQRKLARTAEDDPAATWKEIDKYYRDAIKTYTAIGDQKEVDQTHRELARAVADDPSVT